MPVKSIAVPHRKDRSVRDEDWIRSMLVYELFCTVGSSAGAQAEIDETTVVKISIDKWSGKMQWTDDPERERFHYDDVLGDRRPHLPCYVDMSKAQALTAE